jgi:hypothetical protein
MRAARVGLAMSTWAIRDGLRVDPGVVPDWQSSG